MKQITNEIKLIIIDKWVKEILIPTYMFWLVIVISLAILANYVDNLNLYRDILSIINGMFLALLLFLSYWYFTEKWWARRKK